MNTALKPYAISPEIRLKELGKNFREDYQKRDERVEPRTPYHRDRDRIIWSKAFKRLQNKTQIFPYYVEDHYKRRLTHVLEVCGIATSLAHRLGLNEIVTEAIALGHDIGHAPFGHAGEEALNKVSLKFFENKEVVEDPVPLRGFNHCAHGIEIVSRIEKNKLDIGLNLTFDVRDGILKHICSYEEEKKPYFSLKNITKCSCYKDFRDNHGSLEAQCVWFADKICYLFGDIEDGLRAKIFSGDEIVKHPFIKNLIRMYLKDIKIHPKDEDIEKTMLKEWKDIFSQKTDVMDRFYYARGKAITLSINICVEELEKKIKSNNIDSLDDVLNFPQRLIHVSKELQDLWYDFYKEFMYRKLFKDIRVVDANSRAEQIIFKLFDCYLNAPSLIPPSYREKIRKSYGSLVKEELLPFITARNYITGMTDSFVIQRYEELFYSGRTFPFLTPSRVEEDKKTK
jgi:dGTPase